jgi:hypothetical protein
LADLLKTFEASQSIAQGSHKKFKHEAMLEFDDEDLSSPSSSSSPLTSSPKLKIDNT